MSRSNNPGFSERNNSIDLIKVVATLMVIALHLQVCRAWAGCARIEEIAILCGIAIPLFFMVSGYLMAGKQVQWSYSLRKFFNAVKVPFIICVLYDAILLVRHGVFPFDFPLCLIQKGEWWHFWYFGTLAIIYLFLPFLIKLLHGKGLNITICLLLVICVSFWMLDVFVDFEKQHIPQTFRLWYFILYFLIGARIRLYDGCIKASWYVALLFALLYVVSGLRIKAGGVEYNFGSPFCILYAVSFFLFFKGVHVEKVADSFLWNNARNAVLPTYLFHVILLNKLTMVYVHPFMERMHVFGVGGFFAEFVFTAFAAYVLSMLLTSIPLFNKVFKL